MNQIVDTQLEVVRVMALVNRNPLYPIVLLSWMLSQNKHQKQQWISYGNLGRDGKALRHGACEAIPRIGHKSIARKTTSLLDLGWAMQQKDFFAALVSLLVLGNTYDLCLSQI